MADLFWFSDEQWVGIAPFMPTNQPGARRVDDRRVFSEISRCCARAAARVTVGRVWPTNHRLQPVQPLVGTRLLARHAGRPGRGGLDRRDGIAGQQLCARPSLGTWRERGARTQAIGPSRGGQTTKVHVLTDVLGHPAVIHLTPGNASDVRTTPDVLAQAPGRMRRLLAGRGCDADALRAALRDGGTIPIIPGRRCRKPSIHCDKRRYRDRWRIEVAMCLLKDFRRVATRYDKLAANFASAVALAAVVAFWC